MLPGKSLFFVVSSGKAHPPELPAVTGRSRGSHPAGRPGTHWCRQSHGRYREDWALRGEGCSHAALWQVGEETLSTLELPLLLWILSATCGNKQGSLGCMYTQSVCLHHIQKRVDWCDSRNSQTPSHQFNIILVFELRKVQLSITVISLKLLWNRGIYQKTSSRDETGSANTETEW